MRIQWSCALSGLLVVTACRPASDAPARAAEGLQAVGASVPAARQPHVTAPFDVNDVIHRVQRSYRETEDGFRAIQPTYSVRGLNGRLEYAPRAFVTKAMRDANGGSRSAPTVRGNPVAFETISIARDRELTQEAKTLAADDGSLRIQRGVAEERFENTDDGVEQSWTFERLPAGKGDLRIRVRVDGETYRGQSETGHHFCDLSTQACVRYGLATWIDGAGRRTPIAVAYEGVELVLTVPTQILAETEFPAVLDPTISSETTDNQSVAIGPSPYPEGHPDIAFNGTNFLVVWQDSRGLTNVNGQVGYDVFGALVSSAGALLSQPSFPIDLNVYDQTNPRVAYNGTQFLVVFNDNRNFNGDVFGQIVTSAGALSGGDFSIAAGLGNQSNPDVSALAGNWVVTWQDDSGATSLVHAVTVSNTGGVNAPVTLDAAGTNETTPAVACSTRTCAITYTRTGPAGDLDPYAVALSLTTTVTGPVDLKNPPGNGPDTGVDIAWNGSHYFVVWQDITHGNYDIAARRFTEALVFPDNGHFFVTTNSAQQENPAVSYDGTQFVVAWQDDRLSANSFDISGARVQDNPTHTVTDVNGFLINYNVNSQLFPASASGGGRTLVAWQDARYSASLDTIFGAFVAPSSAISPDSLNGFAIGTSNTRETQPALAFASPYYFLVWADSHRSGGNNYDILGARVQYTGALIDPAGIGVSVNTGQHVSPEIASNGTNFLAAWQDFRNGATNGDIYGTLITPGAQVLQPSGIQISSAAGNQGVPSVAWNGTDFLVAWSDQRNLATTGHDIYGTRVDSTGAVLDGAGTGIAITTAATNQDSPTVASDGANFLVAWHDQSGGASTQDIIGAIVSGGGAVTASNIQIAVAINSQLNPRAAYNGTNYTVVWQDSRAGGNTVFDIFCNSVDSAGNPGTGHSLDTLAAGNRLRPNIVRTGSNTFVTWRRETESDTRLYDLVGVQLTPGLVAVQASPFTIQTNVGNANRPAMAALNASFTLVAYERYATGSSQIERLFSHVVRFP
jgi:hypothetical protein